MQRCSFRLRSKHPQMRLWRQSARPARRRVSGSHWVPATSTRERRRLDVLPEGGTGRQDFLEVQQEIAFAWNEAQIGARRDVLIDCDIPGESVAWVGRSYAEAPEIDGLVYIDPPAKSWQRCKPGEFVSVRINGADGHDLWGEVVQQG